MDTQDVTDTPRDEHRAATPPLLPAPSNNGHGSGGGGGHDDIPTDPPRVRTWGVIVAVIVLLAAFAGLFLLGWRPRQKRLAEIRETASAVEDSHPVVQVMVPQRETKARDLTLPADARAFQETSIFPRANGY